MNEKDDDLLSLESGQVLSSSQPVSTAHQYGGEQQRRQDEQQRRQDEQHSRRRSQVMADLSCPSPPLTHCDRTLTSSPLSTEYDTHVDASIPNYTDVIIIGAGPAGLVTAIQLAQQGVDLVIVDHSRIEYTASDESLPVDVADQLPTQAILLQADTLDLLQELGVINEVILSGKPLQGGIVLVNNKVHHAVQRFEPSSACRYQTAIILEQWRLEKILCDKLMQYDVKIHRHHVAFRLVIRVSDQSTVTNNSDTHPDDMTVVDSDHRVKVLLKRIDPVSRHPMTEGEGKWIRGKFVVGADGVRSMTRRALEIEMKTMMAAQEYLCSDFIVGAWGEKIFEGSQSSFDSSMQKEGNCVYIVHSNCGSCVFFPYKTERKWRMVLQREPVGGSSSSGADSSGFRKLVAPRVEEVKTIVAQLVPGTLVEKVTWRVAYATDVRMAEKFVVERGILLGDAAHSGSPFWSFGLNAAIHDAVALCWRLSAILTRGASLSLLESYDLERRQITQALIHYNLQNRQPLLDYRSVATSKGESLLNNLISRQLVMPHKAIEEGIRAILMPPEAVFHIGAPLDTGDCIGAARLIGFSANEEAVPRPLTLRSLCRDGAFLFLMLVEVLPLGTKQRTIFGCERAENAPRYNRDSLEKLAALGREVSQRLSRPFMGGPSASLLTNRGVKLVWTICGLVDRQAIKSGQALFASGQLIKHIPATLKAFMIDGADLSVPAYSVIDTDFELQDRLALSLQTLPNWITDLTAQVCGDAHQTTRHDAAFALVRPDGRVVCKGYVDDPTDQQILRDFTLKLGPKISSIQQDKVTTY